MTRYSLVAFLLGAFCLQGRATAVDVAGDDWTRLQMQSLRRSENPRDPVDAQLRAGLRVLWADRLEIDEREWQAKPAPSGGSYPARSQWTLLKIGERSVLVSAFAGAAECSQAGSFEKTDLFIWCVLRVQVGGQPHKHIEPACWIESEPGDVPDPALFYMRARIEGNSVRVQVVQRGKPVPECEQRVTLP
jgi:hypothetical protein